MEIGPEAVPESRIGAMPYEKTQIGSIVTSLRKGDVFDVLQTHLTLNTQTSSNGQNLCPANSGQRLPLSY
ncbi:hypothetical protein A259_26957 [Pseudomonas syringae pv. actinidiae ICMP 19070]|nr:hypothetical protein A259_26957 [Pseudomonas syringae pv. actinidiae ICMP 19070]